MRHTARIVAWAVAALAFLAGCGQGSDKASMALLNAVRAGEVDRALELVKKRASPTYADPGNGETAFSVLMRRITQRWDTGQSADPGDVQLVRSFVGVGAGLSGETYRMEIGAGGKAILGSQRPLVLWALAHGEDELAELLFQASTPDIQELALYWLCSERDLERAARLRPGYSAGWNHHQSEVARLLSGAIAGRDAELAVAILAVGAPSSDGRLISAAAEARLPEVIKALVAAGADGGPALEQAAASGGLEAVRALLQAGVPATAGAPLAHAVYHGHWQIVDFLLGQGASVTAKDRAAGPLRFGPGGVPPRGVLRPLPAHRGEAPHAPVP